ncbi:MAG: phage portal protein [Pseudoxanthomonas sp.]|jgi:HK97 family phage portal protein|uniref:phage portal protein n=1 Tax=Pseudoxanthomonas sp. TaxID=1871049 RepID=UPI002589DE61|nr:phage portal protein [Pseudoxanthomonas sp.]MCH2092036.1 phage portal protein [Pseudoxanthomonas sp.]
MKILDMLRGRNERRAEDPSWNALANGGNNTLSGSYVDAKSAESISTVFACVQALSESTACLPLHTYRRNEDGSRERADGHWLSRALERPNDYQSGMEFRETLTASVLLNGNGYARKEFNGAGEVTALHPMHPGRVSIVKLDSGRYRYDYTDDQGRPVRLLAEEVLHLRDRTEAGTIVGKSRVAIARESLGLALSLRTHGAASFGRGARPASVLYNDGKTDLSTEQITSLRGVLDSYSAPANAGKTLIMGVRGLKLESIGLSNEDAQWLEAMNFSVTEVCRMFRVPPILVQTLEQASYNNVESLGAQFVKFSLTRWLTMWESAISQQMLGPIARQRYYAEHAVDALLRGTATERAEFYKTMIDSGVMDTEEARRLENLPQRRVDATPTPQAT